LIQYAIDPFACDRCTLCYDQCAARAVFGAPLLEPMAIDAAVCLKCGGCLEVCRFHAVTVT
jgi:TPP-dependent indolepyruvate ferredoxin oxidoreductase alpha subunit